MAIETILLAVGRGRRRAYRRLAEETMSRSRVRFATEHVPTPRADPKAAMPCGYTTRSRNAQQRDRLVEQLDGMRNVSAAAD
ncbi:hypothetical protein C9J85_12430 [Haloferax sp. wsp5]|nr:hypothetical protein C9J85_12430 [Haloferax sp. wsp5]